MLGTTGASPISRYPAGPPPAPSMPSDADLARDSLVQAEIREFDEGRYDRQAKRNQHDREQSAKNVLHIANVSILIFGLVLFAMLNIVWFIHIAAGVRYLPDESLFVIQNIVAAVWVGKLGMLLERYASKHSDY